jgi:hypothetical protein
MTIGGRHHLQGVEIVPPNLGHRARVVQIALVELFKIGSVRPEQIGGALEGFHHGASPLETSFSSKMRGLGLRPPILPGFRVRQS